jgi:hypothetical protein
VKELAHDGGAAMHKDHKGWEGSLDYALAASHVEFARGVNAKRHSIKGRG